MKMAIVRVTTELLGQLLHFPEDHRVVGVIGAGDDRMLDLVVEGPTLPEVDGGCRMPRMDYLVSLTTSEKLMQEKIYKGRFAAPATSEENAA